MPPRLPTPVEQLGLTVLRNARVRILDDAPARLRLEIDAVYPRWLGPLPRLLGARRVQRYALDGMSLAVWRRLDDRTTLGELCDWLAGDEQLGFHEARLLLLHFLHALAQKGLVVLGDRAATAGAESGAGPGAR